MKAGLRESERKRKRKRGSHRTGNEVGKRERQKVLRGRKRQRGVQYAEIGTGALLLQLPIDSSPPVPRYY